MDYSNNNFETLRQELRITNRDFAKRLDVHEQVYSRLKKGTYPMGSTMKYKVQNAFPDINLDWILFNKGDKQKAINNIGSEDTTLNQNNRYLGQFSDDVIFTTDDGNNIFYEISPGRYLMKTKLVTEKAKAGYAIGYDNQEYVEELPSHMIVVTEFHKGKYRSFEVFGDSMDNGEKKSLSHGEIVTGRSVNREYWKSKLHTHSWEFWIIVTKRDGVVIKQISKHDVENGIITLHSLNKDKTKYPDFDIHLDDVEEIYNVVDPKF